LAHLAAAGAIATPWGRPDYDLDTTRSADALLDRDRPGLVIHSAAWTDVDGCARDPGLAKRRNGDAVDELAQACASRGVALLVVSTNEVFDGRRSDGLGYVEGDPTEPINAYGRSKLAGEQAARRAFGADSGASLWIIRTSWLYGPPGADFPAKIITAASRLPPGQPLRVVADEFGSPTSTEDLAVAITAVLATAPAGTYHVVNRGYTSRAGWASRVLELAGVNVPIERVGQAEFPRASTPPAWGVLDTSLAGRFGIELRPWTEAMDAYLGSGAASG
jgi:dTDP-4-dehydrorhamnose reductase